MNERITTLSEKNASGVKNLFQYIRGYKPNKKQLTYIGIAGVLLLFLSVTFYKYYTSLTAYEIKMEGRVLGIVREKENFTSIMEEVKEEIEEVYKQELVLPEDIEFIKVRAKDEKLTALETLEKNMKMQLDVKVKSVAIIVNGEQVALVRDENTAQEILDTLKTMYLEEDSEDQEVKFGETVEIGEVVTDVGVIREKEDALDYILKGTDEERVHKVAKGESMWTIAHKYGLSVDDVIKANPDINPKTLQIGQEISLVVPKPYISVQTREYKVYNEAIPFDTKYTQTNSLYEGDKKITVQGVEGKKEVKAYIIKENGIEIDREIIEEKVLSEPKTRVIARGTKPRPPTVATGVFTNPTRGRITSRFGMRWGRKHNGIDIAASIGTPITAADAGKVSFVGRSGTYGKLVIIDHENGYQTYYAHCNSFLVKKGERVYKGQKIATVGNTGRSTGPHLHFEVRKNGTPINPLNFVKY